MSGVPSVQDISVIEGLLQISTLDQCGKGNQINQTRAEQIHNDYNVLHRLNHNQTLQWITI